MKMKIAYDDFQIHTVPMEKIVFDETEKLLIRNREDLMQEEEVNLKKEIFWIRDSFKRHTIISLELAESLLWREITGLGIKEVKLYTN